MPSLWSSGLPRMRRWTAAQARPSLEQPVDACPSLIHAPVQFLPGDRALLQRLLQFRQSRVVGDGCAQVRPARQQHTAPGAGRFCSCQLLALAVTGKSVAVRAAPAAAPDRRGGDQQEHGFRISLPVLAVVPDQNLFASTGGHFVIVVVPGVVQLLESPVQAVDSGVWQRVGMAGERDGDADQNRQEACEAFFIDVMPGCSRNLDIPILSAV